MLTFQNERVLILGRAGMDLYADPPGTPLEHGETFTACLGGSSGNIAAGLARQEVRCALLSVVSDDAVGRFTLNALERFGVETAHVRTIAGEERTNLAVVDTLGNRTKAVIYRNEAADLALEPDDVDAIDFTLFGCFVATGTALAKEPSRSATMRAFERARAAGAVTVIDLDYRPYSWPSAEEATRVYRAAAESADIVVGNDDEFAVVAGGDHTAGLAAAHELGAAKGRIAIYKMGAWGAHTIAEGDAFRTGIFRVEALKPTGAGDAFMAGLLRALLDRQSLRDAVTRGAATAAIVVARVGCSAAMPTRGDVDAFMKAHQNPATSERTDHAHRAL